MIRTVLLAAFVAVAFANTSGMFTGGEIGGLPNLGACCTSPSTGDYKCGAHCFLTTAQKCWNGANSNSDKKDQPDGKAVCLTAQVACGTRQCHQTTGAVRQHCFATGGKCYTANSASGVDGTTEGVLHCAAPTTLRCGVAGCHNNGAVKCISKDNDFIADSSAAAEAIPCPDKSTRCGNGCAPEGGRCFQDTTVSAVAANKQGTSGNIACASDHMPCAPLTVTSSCALLLAWGASGAAVAQNKVTAVHQVIQRACFASATETCTVSATGAASTAANNGSVAENAFACPKTGNKNRCGYHCYADNDNTGKCVDFEGSKVWLKNEEQICGKNKIDATKFTCFQDQKAQKGEATVYPSASHICEVSRSTAQDRDFTTSCACVPVFEPKCEAPPAFSCDPCAQGSASSLFVSLATLLLVALAF